MAFQRGGQPRTEDGARMAPKCRPCTAEDHAKCPTAIARHGDGNFSSDYECPCYHADPTDHAGHVEDADEEFYSSRDDVYGDDRPGRWDSRGGFLHGY